MAEYALAKHYGKTLLQDWCETKAYVAGEAYRKIPCDCGANLHVRSSLRPEARLCVHPWDPNPGIFILAIAYEAECRFLYKGWQTAGIVKACGQWMVKWRDPCFALDSCYLLPMDTIPPEDIWLPQNVN